MPSSRLVATRDHHPPARSVPFARDAGARSGCESPVAWALAARLTRSIRRFWRAFGVREGLRAPRAEGGQERAMTHPASASEPVDLEDDVLFGDIWQRSQLSKRDRSLVTCAALVAQGRTEELSRQFPKALENGVTQAELIELITHLAFYVGAPDHPPAADPSGGRGGE